MVENSQQIYQLVSIYSRHKQEKNLNSYQNYTFISAFVLFHPSHTVPKLKLTNKQYLSGRAGCGLQDTPSERKSDLSGAKYEAQRHVVRKMTSL